MKKNHLIYIVFYNQYFKMKLNLIKNKQISQIIRDLYQFKQFNLFSNYFMNNIQIESHTLITSLIIFIPFFSTFPLIPLRYSIFYLLSIHEILYV